MLGVLGTTINNRLRMKELRDLVEDTASKNSGHQVHLDIAALSTDLSASIKQTLAQTVISDSGEKRIQELMTGILNEVKAQNNSHLQRTAELESALLMLSSGSDVPAVITGKADLEAILDHQKTDITRILIVSSVLVPLCTWALCKFVSL